MKPVTTILKVGNAVVQLMVLFVRILAVWINRTSSSIVLRYT